MLKIQIKNNTDFKSHHIWFLGDINKMASTCLRKFITLYYKCDPPRENRGKGECTGTFAMTRDAKRDTIERICAYFISKTKNDTCLLFGKLKLLFEVVSKMPCLTCNVTRVRKDTRVIRQTSQNIRFTES